MKYCVVCGAAIDRGYVAVFSGGPGVFYCSWPRNCFAIRQQRAPVSPAVVPPASTQEDT